LDQPYSSLTDLLQEMRYPYVLGMSQSSDFLALTLHVLVTGLRGEYNGALYWFSTILYILVISFYRSYF